MRQRPQALRPRALIAAGLLGASLLAAAGRAAGAQARQEQRHDFDTAEGRLLGFYSASLMFGPLGLAAPGPAPRLAFGVELGYVPRLNDEQRAIGTDKPENTNLAPIYPRPRVAVGLPGRVVLEASWLPPVKVFGVTANFMNAAISGPLGTVGPVSLRGRLGAPWGRVRGSITCSGDVAEQGDADLRLYYNVICNGRDSEDEFRPRHVSAELIATGRRVRSVAGGTWAPWAAIGARREWTRFDIGVIRDDGTRDPDHPILVLHGTRPHGSVGIGWAGPRTVTLAGEMFYAPGSLATARVYAGLRR